MNSVRCPLATLLGQALMDAYVSSPYLAFKQHPIEQATIAGFGIKFTRVSLKNTKMGFGPSYLADLIPRSRQYVKLAHESIDSHLTPLLNFVSDCFLVVVR